MPPNAHFKPSPSPSSRPSPSPSPGEVTRLIETQNELTERLMKIIDILGKNNINNSTKQTLKDETADIKQTIANIQRKIHRVDFLGQTTVEELLGGRRRRLRKTRRVRRSKKTYRKRR